LLPPSPSPSTPPQINLANMRVATILSFVGAASAHAIFQNVKVNGADQGLLYGIRAPSSNFPIEDVNDAAFACNKNLQYKDNNVITIPAGAQVGARYQHIIGGPQGSNDPDNPIASSHKGMSNKSIQPRIILSRSMLISFS